MNTPRRDFRLWNMISMIAYVMKLMNDNSIEGQNCGSCRFNTDMLTARASVIRWSCLITRSANGSAGNTASWIELTTGFGPSAAVWLNLKSFAWFGRIRRELCCTEVNHLIQIQVHSNFLCARIATGDCHGEVMNTWYASEIVVGDFIIRWCLVEPERCKGEVGDVCAEMRKRLRNGAQ